MYNDFIESYATFENAKVQNPLLETLRLFDILSNGRLRETTFSDIDQTRINLDMLIEKRKQGIPMEYILGKTSFMGRTYFCSPDTFLPTEDTRTVVEAALSFIKKREDPGNQLFVLDIGTGCGNLAITLALNSKYTTIFASDINPAAIDIAKKNVSQYDLRQRIFLFAGDAFKPFQALYEGKVDMIISNPPYIPTGSLHKLPREIIDHGPRAALDGGPYGVDFYSRLIKEAVPMLKPKGVLLFEIGERQEKLIMRLFEKNKKYKDIKHYLHHDKIRAMSAIKKDSDHDDQQADDE